MTKHLLLLAFLIAIAGGVLATHRESKATSAVLPENAAASYATHCASCHGRDGRSKTLKAKRNHARNLTDGEWQTRVSDERIFNAIMNGKGKMPAYSKKLSEQQIDALVSYVRNLRR